MAAIGQPRGLPLRCAADVYRLAVYIHAMICPCRGGTRIRMTRNRIVHKHVRLDAAKIKLTKKHMKARTETETIERALDLVISERQRNRITRGANERFIKSRIEVKDVYGKLAG